MNRTSNHALRRTWIRLALTGSVLVWLFAGCATVPAEPPPERLTGEEDPFQAPAREMVGSVILVDPAEELALIQMNSSRTRPAPILITRNPALVETARLEPTRFQRGRVLGARILSGLPNVGDEVVVDR